MMREKSGILWILGISESIFDLWTFFVSTLGSKDLILGLWWLILSLKVSNFCFGSRFWVHGIFFGPLWVDCERVEVYFGFQRPSLTFWKSNLGHLVHFKLLTVDYRPPSFNFGPMEINIVLCQMTILHRKLILGIMLDLWESILESGSLF